MSMTFFATRSDSTAPARSHGPLDETEDLYFAPGVRTLAPTQEQLLESGCFDGPNLSNSNAEMVLRSLGYEINEECAYEFNADDLLGRVTLAGVIPPIADDGIADLRVGNMVQCGVRPGYFQMVYEGIAAVCEQAIQWKVPVYCT